MNELRTRAGGLVPEEWLMMDTATVSPPYLVVFSLRHLHGFPGTVWQQSPETQRGLFMNG